MAFDAVLAHRIRSILGLGNGVSERKMFGGIAFMDRGNMCVGIIGEDLMVRVGATVLADALALPGTRPMDFAGRPSPGVVYVVADVLTTDQELAAWVGRGLQFTATLPPKE